jgi:hypothetical protein
MGRRRILSAGALVVAFAAFEGTLGAPAAAAQTAQAPVTFSKDVAPIFQRSCQNCHRPGSIAPMSLLRYEDTRPWVRAIKQRVSQRQMPPWHVDKNVGITKFKDDPSLTDTEIATIVAWIDGGAPQGNPADLPPARQFDDTDKWHIGKPDLVVSMPSAFEVAPQAEDWWGNFVADTGLTEDRYIKAVEAKPGPNGGSRVVHHAIASLVSDGGPTEGGALVEYAVGKNGDVFPDGSGKLMRAGSKMNFNLHYHAVGEAIKDRTEVGIVFYPKGVVPQHVLNTAAMDFYDLDLPAGAENVRTDIYYKFEKPTRLAGFMPHMHNRGKAECLEVIYPSMAVEQLNCVSHFDFQWQIAYNYADDVTPLLPAGTILHVVNWHDNSKGNRLNPDPRNWVGYGQRTVDEMSRFWITYYSLSEDEFQALVAERNSKKASSTTNNNQQ